MENKKYIRLFKPSVGKEEINSIKKVFKKSWLGYGSKVKEFEKKFSSFIGTKYAVGLNSCTAALHLALAVNNFKKKKKVLLPTMTFSATAASILYNDLIPVFVDVNKKDLNISFEDLKKKYTKDCVAVMAVHFGGHPCQMDKIVPWAKKKNMIVIEDCAHTCGGTYKGKKLGTWGDYSCFSFEDKKVITTGDGGMLCTNKKNKINLLRSLSFHGWSKDPWQRHLKGAGKKHWYYEVRNLGFKYNMNNLLAAIGISQLKKLNQLNKKRILVLKKYLSVIKNFKNISLAFPYHLNKSCYWLLTLRIKKRDQLINYLKTKGISTSVHLMPLPLHPLYKKYRNKTNNSTKVWKELFSLPFFPDIKKTQIDYVLKFVKKFENGKQ
jgi:perosamine synthetase|tara:strand:- start:1466 stop:2605 length:1140 start_codon:yes stop_codon:yes gene_type:complete